VPGDHVTLKCGQLYLPDFFQADSKGPTQLVIWTYGAAWCAEQNFYEAGKNAVHLTLSAATFKAGFGDASLFTSLVDEINSAIKTKFPNAKPIGRICIGSFSAGYTAARDILRHEELYSLISDVVLADSLYAPRARDRENQLDDAAMAPFLAFANRAAEGKAKFIFSHLYPPEEKFRGNTTTLAANYLIDHLHGTRTATSGTSSVGAKLLYRCDVKGFHVLGYEGMTNQDHFNHFYGSADLLRDTSLSDAPAKLP
jgi:hypothetical protein